MKIPYTTTAGPNFKKSISLPARLLDLRDKLPRKKSGIEKCIKNLQRQTYGRHIRLTAEEVSDCQHTVAEEKRIDYYLGTIGEHGRSLNPNTRDFDLDEYTRKFMLADYDSILQANLSNSMKVGYTLPLLNLFNLLPTRYKKKQFIYISGDHVHPSRFEGILAKTRLCDDRAVTLLNLNPKRHWEHIPSIPALDVEYRQKKDMAIWRGAPTGKGKTKGTRRDLVNKFFDDPHHFDVGFITRTNKPDPGANLFKDGKTIAEMLRYKFLICLEGNDVASGLKWMLYSNSVVMMPKPSISSWLMEDMLEPFVHYIPLADDFSDAEEQFEWAMDHESECIEISNNASHYMSQFMDPRREIMIECEVFRRYLDRIE